MQHTVVKLINSVKTTKIWRNFKLFLTLFIFVAFSEYIMNFNFNANATSYRFWPHSLNSLKTRMKQKKVSHAITQNRRWLLIPIKIPALFSSGFHTWTWHLHSLRADLHLLAYLIFGFVSNKCCEKLAFEFKKQTI